MVDRSVTSKTARAIKDLGADGPDPELEEKLMLFGQFIGDWDITEARYPQPDGTEIKRRGEIHSTLTHSTGNSCQFSNEPK